MQKQEFQGLLCPPETFVVRNKAATRMRRSYLRLAIFLLTLATLYTLLFLTLGPSFEDLGRKLLASDDDRRVDGVGKDGSGSSSSSTLWYKSNTGSTLRDSRLQDALVSDVRVSQMLPGGNGTLRWTVLHASVWQDQRASSKGPTKPPTYLEVTAMIEDTYYNNVTLRHQIMVPDLDPVVRSSACRFDGSMEITPATLTWKMPYAPWALLMRCRIPDEATLPGAAYLDLHLADDRSPAKTAIATQRLALERRKIAQETTRLALCTAPLFGRLNMPRLLEWRLHHARLGIKTVHWYDREGRQDIIDFVGRLNRNEKLRDTYTHAPPLSPETYGTEIFLEKGLYADQVLYSIECLERSKYTAPSEWLGYIDMDEYFLPQPFTSDDSFTDWISNSINSSVTSVCIDRNSFHRTKGDPLLSKLPDPSAGPVPESEFAMDDLVQFIPRGRHHQEDNRKCFHRTEELLVPFVHWSILTRSQLWSRSRSRSPDQASVNVVVDAEDGSPRLVHNSLRYHDDERYQLFDRSPAFTEHLAKVKAAVKRNL